MRKRTFWLMLLLLALAAPVVGGVGLWAIDAGYWRGLLIRHVEAAIGRKLEITGPLSVSWGLRPTITVEGLKLANAPWAAAPTLVEVRRLELQLELLSLLRGSPEIDRLSLIEPSLELETSAGGKQNWDLADSATSSGQPASAVASSSPIIRQATVEKGTIRYLAGDSGAITTVRVARGTVQGEDSDGSAKVDLHGEVDDVAASLAGRLAQASAVLVGALDEVALADLTARLGDTELTGTATLNWAGEQTYLRADLATDRLDPASFLAIKVHPARDGAARNSAVEALTTLDADVRLRAGVVRAGKLDATKLEGTGKLNAGRLDVGPLRLEFYGRPVTGSLLLDGGKQPPVAAASVAADSIEVGRVLAGLGLTELIEGQGVLRAELRGHGPAPHDWAATAAGHVRLLMNDGQMRNELMAQLAGGLRQLAGSLAGGQSGQAMRVRCVVLDVPVEGGVARPDLILDTDYTTLVAHGTVDLRRDRVDLTLTPRARALDLNVALPVTIRGRLDDPSYGVDETDAARRLVSLLGSAIFPPAALGAFVDFGGAADNGCLALLADPHASAAAPAATTGPLDAAKDAVEGLGQDLKDLLTPNR